MGKLKFSRHGMGGFFVRHIEKITFGVVLLLTSVFVYSGYSLEGLNPSQTPDKLKADAESAKSHIMNPQNWDNIKPQINPTKGQPEQVAMSQIPLKPNLYEWDKPLEPVNFQEGKRRADPIILAPERVEVQVVVGATVHKPGVPGNELLASDTKSAYEKKKERKKRSTGPAGASAPSGGKVAGFIGEVEAEASVGTSGPTSGGAGGGGGEVKVVDGAIMVNPNDRRGYRASPNESIRPQTCVAVKAAFPWRKQFDEYHDKFWNSLGYNPLRDTPRFLSFTAERAEVTDDPNAELKWTRVAYTSLLQKQITNNSWEFAGYPADIADQRYRYDMVLTMPIPPFVERDYEQFALHSLVPKTKPRMVELTAEQKAMIAKLKEDMQKLPDSDLPMVRASAATMMTNSGLPFPTAGGPSIPGVPTVAQAPGQATTSSYIGSDSGSGSGSSGSGSGSSGGSSGDMGSTGSSGSGGSGGDMFSSSLSGIYTGPPAKAPEVDYLLIRFFDFTAEVGKKYCYRVQVIVEDPNHPEAAALTPSERFLEDTAKTRVSALEKTTYFLRSPFSEPSDVVSVEVESKALAGYVAPVKASTIKEADNLVVQDVEPTGKLMSVIFDYQRAVDVPGITDVYRGSVLNFKANADVIDPVNMLYKRLTDVEFKTDRFVADIRGGVELPEAPAPEAPKEKSKDKDKGKEKPKPAEKSQPLLTLGEYAVVDAHGKLRVRTEYDDYDTYRRLELPPSPDAATPVGPPSEPAADPGLGIPGRRTPR